jgi:spore maturation protein CgeB
MLSIVYIGKKSPSFDYLNLYGSLRRMKNIDLTYIPSDEAADIGVQKMNEHILRTVEEKKPDLFLAVMTNEDLDPRILMKIKTMTTSAGWFCDDHSSFYLNTTRWGHYFTWCVTMYSKVIPEYKKRGIPVIGSQLGANHWLFHPSQEALDGKPRYDYDVTFVGGWYRHRGRVINDLRNAGITVRTWGLGWPEGAISDDEMIRIAQRSKINLDINPPSSHIGLKPLVALFVKRDHGKFRWVGNRFADNVRLWLGQRTPVIKSRTFNTLAARGFMITQMTHDLPEYYEIDKEIASYATTDELIQKIKYYLSHDAEREAVAEAGYRRTLRDHTYEKRLTDIFQKMGLRYP